MLDLTVQDFNGEPRMRDADIAVALDFERVRDVRKLIDRCADQLALFGEVFRATVARNTVGRPVVEVWLNEHQAFYLCTQSKAPRAVEVTQEIIRVFVAWKNGRLVASGPEVTPRATCLADMLEIASLVREARLTHGRKAGQMMWRKMGMPDLPIEEPTRPSCLLDAPAAILEFFEKSIHVTERQNNFVRSATVYAAYCDFWVGEDVLSMPAFTGHLIALSREYVCPLTGGRFRHCKSSGHTGWKGIRLIS